MLLERELGMGVQIPPDLDGPLPDPCQRGQQRGRRGSAVVAPAGGAGRVRPIASPTPAAVRRPSAYAVTAASTPARTRAYPARSSGRTGRAA